MKSFSIILSLLLFSVGLTAQPWTKNLPDKKAKEYTFYDYQKTFNDYWAPYNVKNGRYINEAGEEKRASGWRQFKRWEWHTEPQVNIETGKFPKESANEVYNRWLANNPKSTAYEADWVSLGPKSSAGGYAGVGRINTIAFHPTDNDTYWVAAPAGGVWRTSDNGNSWTCLTDGNDVLGVSDIIIPSDYETSNTMYIATGDRDAWDNRSVGVLKSTNGGSSWSYTDLRFSLADGEMTTRLLAHPQEDETIIAATTAGVFKTTNGGINWNDQLTDRYFIDMDYKPDDFNTLYGSTTSGSIYMTNNGGDTWQEVLSLNAGRIELAVTPADPEIVYAVAGANNNGLYGIYKSMDSGESFERVFDGTVSGNNLLGWYQGEDTGGQAWFDLSIAVSPQSANTILVGGVNTWRSLNGGQSWDMVNHWYGGYSVQEVHADKHNLKFRSNGDLFECNDGGIYISKNIGNSGSWVDITNGMTVSQMYRLGVSQSNPGEVIIGLQDNGTKVLYASSWYDVRGGDGMECIIDYTDNTTQYATVYYGQISRTFNHWNYSTDISPQNAGAGAWVTPYIMDPHDNETLYAGYADVWKTTDQGNNWTKISNMNSNTSKLRSLAIAPSNTQVLYAADPYTIWKTENGGNSWTNISAGLPSNFITYITVKHNDPETLWVTLGGYDENAVFRSTDGGDSWENISHGLPELPAYSIVQNRQEFTQEHLYVGTELGIYFKKGDENWVDFNDGLPNVKIGEIEMYYDNDNPDNSKLKAASYGRGLWETSPIAVTTDITTIKGEKPVSVYPNPSSGPVYIESNQYQNFTVKLTDISGKQIADYRVSGGRKELNLSKFGAGVYLLIFEIDEKTYLARITVQ